MTNRYLRNSITSWLIREKGKPMTKRARTLLLLIKHGKSSTRYIHSVLRQLDVTVWDADSLLADPAVSDHLDTEPTISESDGEDFGKKLEPFLSTCDGGAIWPLVESVHISGPFPVLSTGITLFDLPGHGDVDNGRAIDDRVRSLVLHVPRLLLLSAQDTHQYLQKQVGEKSISLVLTGADIPFDEKGVEPELAAVRTGKLA
ncbi:hypothetical protein B0H14DRAFT_2632748 [Mycena olivaceomarginata]|nr:hypothetical protein B0H14DRAFT_2632748 [Mycena olivaceomarginata]